MKPNVHDMPKSIGRLDRDVRGYPVPFIVLRDRQGKPLFALNDMIKMALCRRMALCSVCGNRLHPWGRGSADREMWFVSGSRAFLCQGGVFRDPPVHYVCGQYSLKVCPFLAAPSYTKSVGMRQVAKLPGLMTVPPVAFSGPMHPEWFGIGLARVAYWSDESDTYWMPTFEHLEFWQKGVHVAAPTADDVKRLVNL